jgi:glycosyltransferase involved in cell wall biosynthesis
MRRPARGCTRSSPSDLRGGRRDSLNILVNDMIKLSVYLVTQNEEKRLPRTMEALAKVADEIVVVDSGSTDRTEEIARKYGARFIHNDWISIGHQVKFAEEQCSYDWVLRLDADEVLSDELIDDILSIKRAPAYDGYLLRICDMYPGYAKPNRWVKHYKLIRLYNREKITMSGKLGHDDVVFLSKDVRTKVLHGLVHHYSFVSMHQMLEKRNIATDRQVTRALEEGKNYSPWRMVGVFSMNLFKYFILGRGFLYGWWGFINAVNLGYMRFLKFSKFYEHEQMKKHGY